MQPEKKLFLLDAMALIYRAYFAFNKNPLINSKGVNTSAIYGFTDTLTDLLNKEKPTHIAVAFDTPDTHTDRRVEFAFYKANRQAMPEDIMSGLLPIKNILDALNIPMLEAPGFEADDVIGTVAKKAEKEGFRVFMVTPDKDFGQLVSENIFIYKPSYMGKGIEILGVPEVLKRWEIKEVKQVIDMLGLQGDASDNIPGIPGVGPKTAQKLIADFESVEGVIENADKLKGSLKDKVVQFADQALVSKRLATIICDLPVEFEEARFIRSEPDKERIIELFAEFEFRTLGRKILGADFVASQSGATSATSVKVTVQTDLFGNIDAQQVVEIAKEHLSPRLGKDISSTEHVYELVNTAEKRKELIDCLSKQDFICFDTETSSLDANSAEMVGISFSCEPHTAYYVPLPVDHKESEAILNEFRPVLENESIGKIGQNLKYDILVLKWYDIEVKGKLFDTMLAHYLVEPEMRHNMNYLSENYLKYSPISIEVLIGKKGKNQGNMRDVLMEKIAEYAAEDADVTLQLHKVLHPMLGQRNAEKLFTDVEIPLMNVLASMEYEGVAIDSKFLSEYSEVLHTQIKEIEKEVFEIAGEPFNLGSPKQLGEILFDKLKIPYKGKKTKSGQYSTGEDILAQLANEYDFAKRLMDHRELCKLKSTYIDALPQLVNPKTNRVHTSFNQAVTATGRLSSTSPNLQNIPIRTERGREIRKAFIPRNVEYQILSADYSQIELRLIAEISEDAAMMEDFLKGLDIHTATAARVYNIPVEEVSPEMRRNAKFVNFGLIYGISAFGLSQKLGTSRGEAKDLIDQYFQKYSGIRSYMTEAIQTAREKGYAETLLGRRRYLRDINSVNATVRGFAERNAINAPIQGSAADLIKIAMIQIHDEFKKQKLRSKMTLQVHDELVFDVHRDEVEIVKPIIKERMSNAMKLKVPLVVDMGIGENWLEAH